MPTPMMKQYLGAKAEHPDAILFFRMGDFYETFHDDAVLVAGELELTLTARDKDGPDPVPMAGVPHHAANGYIRRLLERGYSVAICEQLEDPSKSKGIVPRGVVRVVTPGTHLDIESLEAKQNNFITAVAVSNLRTADVLSVASLDVSTGEFRVCEVLSADAVTAELQRLRPAEVLVARSQSSLLADTVAQQRLRLVERSDEALSLPRAIRNAASGTLATIDGASGGHFLRKRDIETMVSAVDEWTTRDRKAVDSAIALVLNYLADTQGGVPGHIAAPEVYRSEAFLTLDPASAANLEIFETLMGGNRNGSLFAMIDQTVTAAGGRRLRTWLSYPLKDAAAIQDRQNAVTELRDRLSARQGLREALKNTVDLQRVSGKLAAGQGNARDIVTLADTLERVPGMKSSLAEFDDPALSNLAEELDPCADVVAMIRATLVEEPPIGLSEGGLINEGYSDELDELIELTTRGKQWLLNYEAEQRKAHGISSLKVRHNKVFGYFIEVTKANMERVPDSYIRKQTLANAERYFTPELKEYEEKILSASEKRHVLEFEYFEQLRMDVIAELGRLRDTAGRIAELDALAALAELSHSNAWVAPTMTEDKVLNIENGRHPVVESMLRDERFVPNDAILSDNTRLLIITGPNMAGKSTVIRQVAVIVLLAQIGSHVPATRATIGVVDQIFSRVGASDNLARGQSTFMVEMSEVAHILNHATDRSLVILDEIGRGTATYDGLSIAWSVAEHLHDSVGAFALFATHYHELTKLARIRDGVENFNIAVKEWNDEIVFLRKLVPGAANRSYGIQVARLAGVPDPVVDRAREILDNLEESARADGELEPPLAREHVDGQPVAKPSPQLSIFAPSPVASEETVHRENPVFRELREFSVDASSPLEALNQIARWQRAVARKRK